MLLNPCLPLLKLFLHLLNPQALMIAHPHYICLHDLQCIYALQLVAGEDVPCNITDAPFDEAPVYKIFTLIKALEASFCDVDMAFIDEERLLKHFTCHQLKRLKNWPDWDDAFDAQLNAHWLAVSVYQFFNQLQSMGNLPMFYVSIGQMV